MGNLAYNILNASFSFILSLFYGKIDVRGLENIPKRGPVIFCGTHGNGLIDPVLIMCIAQRQISPIAKSTLFTIPVLGSILRAFKAVPVRRRQDFQNATQDNSGALDAMANILIRGDCLVIFPEGVSHNEPEVHALKTGFARAAVQAVLAVNSSDYYVTVVPVGLNFVNKEKFRSNIFVEFGKSTTVTKESVFGDAPAKDYEQVSRKFVVDLTDKIKRQLEEVFVTAPSWDLLRVLYLARDLYLDQGDPIDEEEFIKLTHRFVNGYQKAKEEEEVANLVHDVEVYQSQLDLLRITDRLVGAASLSTGQIILHFFSTLGFYLFTLPVSLPGALVHAPIGLLCKALAKFLTNTKHGVDIDQVAHFKIMSAIVLTPVFYLGMGIAIWRTLGIAFVAPVLICTFLSGYMAIQTRPLTFTLKALGFVIKFLFTDFNALKKTRKSLRARVHEIINKYRDKYDIPTN